MSDSPYQVSADGFTVIPSGLGAAEMQTIARVASPARGAGRRGILGIPEVGALARSERLLALARPHLPEEPRPVRAIFFDKTQETNWVVAWHQDLTIAVRERADHPGFGPWSVKNGIPHVQPPTSLLERMITLRLHLDDADEGNGALRVLPGSHLQGRLTESDLRDLRESTPEHVCRAAAGGILLMRPLLAHASGRSTDARHRRVLHVEYAGFSLPPGLRWHDGA